MTTAEGPFFEELAVDQVFDWAPAVTLTSGQAATHQAIVGDRMHLPLDSTLCAEVVGAAPLAHPALVWDIAIGQSTLATQHVKANLFYRGLVFHRAPLIGDTLRTSTEVVALRQNKPREGHRPTGLAVLRITTVDQLGRPVLGFWRCAMLPLRDPDARTGREDVLEPVGGAADDQSLAASVSGWRLGRFAGRATGRAPGELHAGTTWEVGGGDVVSNAPELARLTLNIASVHHDESAAGGPRLVYGGHAIGLALAQATRAFPRIVTVLGWHGCDHMGPVREGDTLHSAITIERIAPLAESGALVHLRSRVRTAAGKEVLDWRYAAVMA
jgi:acyl dehydratase